MFLYMQVTNKAVAVGFGISTPDHIRQVKDVFPIYKDSFVLLFSSKFYSFLTMLLLLLPNGCNWMYTGCTMGCRWSDNRQRDGKAFGWSWFSKRRFKEVGSIRQEPEGCTQWRVHHWGELGRLPRFSNVMAGYIPCLVTSDAVQSSSVVIRCPGKPQYLWVHHWMHFSGLCNMY